MYERRVSVIKLYHSWLWSADVEQTNHKTKRVKNESYK